MKVFDLIISEYLDYFFIKKRSPGLIRKLKQLAIKARREAIESYQKLKPPKIVPQDIYIENWIRDVVSLYLASRTINQTRIDNPPPDLQASVKFHLAFPPQLQTELRKRFFKTELKKRPSIWRSFQLPVKELEKKFKDVVKEKQKLAQKRGFSSYLDFFLWRYKIPKSDYQLFTNRIDQIIEFLNQSLSDIKSLPEGFYSRFNIPCFLCLSAQFPFRNFSEVIDWVVKQNPYLARFQNRIDLKFESRDSQLLYVKEADRFKIILDKNINFRHQVLELIHELSHLISYLESFNQGINPRVKGCYWREKEALRTEWNILRNAPAPLFHGLLSELLLSIREVLFEIELYAYPDQNLSQLYARTFNCCFKEARQRNNPLYLLDRSIIYSPFRSLSHIVGVTSF